jgi:hypothetical protein
MRITATLAAALLCGVMTIPAGAAGLGGHIGIGASSRGAGGTAGAGMMMPMTSAGSNIRITTGPGDASGMVTTTVNAPAARTSVSGSTNVTANTGAATDAVENGASRVQNAAGNTVNRARNVTRNTISHARSTTSAVRGTARNTVHNASVDASTMDSVSTSSGGTGGSSPRESSSVQGAGTSKGSMTTDPQ